MKKPVRRYKPGYVRKSYKSSELEEAIAVLQKNHYHCFESGDAKGIVMALHQRGYRIIRTGYSA